MKTQQKSQNVSVKNTEHNRGISENCKKFDLYMVNLDTNHVKLYSECLSRKEIFYMVIDFLNSKNFPVNRYLVSFSKSFFACYNYYFKNCVTKILADLSYIKFTGFDSSGCIPILNLIPCKDDSCRTCFFVKEVCNG